MKVSPLFWKYRHSFPWLNNFYSCSFDRTFNLTSLSLHDYPSLQILPLFSFPLFIVLLPLLIISGCQLLFAGFCFAYSQSCSISRKNKIVFHWLLEFCILGKISAMSILFTAYFCCKNQNLDMACFAMSRVDLVWLSIQQRFHIHL